MNEHLVININNVIVTFLRFVLDLLCVIGTYEDESGFDGMLTADDEEYTPKKKLRSVRLIINEDLVSVIDSNTVFSLIVPPGG